MIWIRLETICPPLLGGLARCHPLIGARAGHISETVSVGRRLSVRGTTDEMGNVKNRKVSTLPKIIQLSNWSSLFISCRYDIFPWIIFLSLGDLIFCSLVIKYLPGSLMSSPSLLSAVSGFLSANVCSRLSIREERVTRRNGRKLITLRIMRHKGDSLVISDFPHFIPRWIIIATLLVVPESRPPTVFRQFPVFWRRWRDSLMMRVWDVALGNIIITLSQSYRRDSELTQEQHVITRAITSLRDQRRESRCRLRVINNESVALLSVLRLGSRQREGGGSNDATAGQSQYYFSDQIYIVSVSPEEVSVGEARGCLPEWARHGETETGIRLESLSSRVECCEEIHLLFSMLRWWWTKLHAFIPGVRNKLSSYFQALSRQQNDLTYSNRRYLIPNPRNSYLPLFKSVRKCCRISFTGAKTTIILKTSSLLWIFFFPYSSIVKLSCPSNLSWKAVWFGSEEWGHPAWNQRQWMENGRRHQAAGAGAVLW